jgi:hypothetical protein
METCLESAGNRIVMIVSVGPLISAGLIQREAISVIGPYGEVRA